MRPVRYDNGNYIKLNLQAYVKKADEILNHIETKLGQLVARYLKKMLFHELMENRLKRGR